MPIDRETAGFCSLLRRLRLRAGLSQQELAERAGISAESISALERGVRRAPYASTRNLLAAALALTPDERTEWDAAVTRRRGPRRARTPHGRDGKVARAYALTDKASTRAALRRVTAADAGRRVILSACVGADVAEYLAQPCDVEIYCSPDPLGTDPDGLAALLRKGARIWFVECLHADVYWSEHAGCLVGPSRVSAGAPGDARFFETLRRADGVDIDLLLRQLARHAPPVAVTPGVLETFRRAHRRAHGHPQPPVRRARDRARFDEWARDPYRKPFSVLRSDERDAPDLTEPERQAVRAYNELHDTRLGDAYTDVLTVYGPVVDLPENEDVLCVGADDGGRVRASGAFWLRCELRTAGTTGPAGRDGRTRFIQVRPRRESVPFAPGGAPLRNALNAYFERHPAEAREGAVFATGSRNERALLRAACA